MKVVCTLEDHVLRNGFGAGVIEQLSDAGIHTPVVRIGWPDQFVEHGTPSILRKKQISDIFRNQNVHRCPYYAVVRTRKDQS